MSVSVEDAVRQADFLCRYALDRLPDVQGQHRLSPFVKGAATQLVAAVKLLDMPAGEAV